jgi:hypothetical protein
LTFGSSKNQILPQAHSADGGRYSDGKTEFWIKGMPTIDQINCISPSNAIIERRAASMPAANQYWLINSPMS